MDGRDRVSEGALSAHERDREQVRLYLAGRDEASFRELYRAHTPALYRFAVLRVGADAAEDVVQETWLRAARGLAGFNWRASLRTWFIGIALNVCREHSGRQSRLRAVPDGELGEQPAAARPVVPATDLQHAIQELPEGYREVLLLHDVEGHTHNEIGEILGISAGTSKSQLHHARRRLRRRIGKGEQRHG